MDTIASPVIFIVGPTASGKTGLSIEIAKEYSGEIICADSRTVYKGMDIGTAKPMSERAGVLHWGIDLVKPNESFNAAKFQNYAQQKIREIIGRGRIPIVVGGTGLYIDALLFDYQFPEPVSPEIKNKLKQMTQQELYEYCVKNNYEIPENDKNKRHLVQKIVLGDAGGKRSQKPNDNFIVVGIATRSTVLKDNITTRIQDMFACGVVDETKKLAELYGWENEPMTGNIYRLIHQNLMNDSMSKDSKEIIRKAATLDLQLAKRQMTWFRRNPYIKWCSLDEARIYISHILAPE